MIRIWVDAAEIVAGGRPIMVRAPRGAYRTSLCEIKDARGALVATIRYSHHRPPSADARVWIEVEPTANVSITDRRLTVEGRTESPQEA